MRKTELRLLKKPVLVNGEPFYLVRYPQPNGKGGRRHFKKKSDAQIFLEQKATEIENHGVAAASLNERDRAEYLECREALKPYGISLRDAVRMLKPQLAQRNKSSLIADAVGELIKAKKADGLSKRYIKDIESRLGIFARAFPDSTVSDFDTAGIDDWLRGLDAVAVTRNNYRRYLGVFFSFAVGRKWTLSNPVTQSSKAKETQQKVGILQPEQARRLLEAADDKILPAIALGLFAGLRPESEIWRMDWRHIDLTGKLIDIEFSKTETGKRFVKMEQGLVDYLAPYVKESGAVSPKGDKYFQLLKKAREGAKIDEWPADCLRHSFGSYHFAHFQNIGVTMAQMGHTNPKTFLKHYRERVKPEVAKKYWALSPITPSNVRSIKSTKAA
jgi:integrase